MTGGAKAGISIEIQTDSALHPRPDLPAPSIFGRQPAEVPSTMFLQLFVCGWFEVAEHSTLGLPLMSISSLHALSENILTTTLGRHPVTPALLMIHTGDGGGKVGDGGGEVETEAIRTSQLVMACARIF